MLYFYLSWKRIMKILKIVLIITNFVTCSWAVDYDLPDKDFLSFQSKQEIR